jgi:hypothetical protein
MADPARLEIVCGLRQSGKSTYAGAMQEAASLANFLVRNSWNRCLKAA